MAADERRRPMTQAREAGPGMPETAGVPAKREETGRDITDLSVAQQAAALATTKWGNLMDLPAEKAEVLFAALSHNFPDLGPVQLNNGFCLLGGSTIYDKGEFWLDRMAGDDRCVGKPECYPVEPATPEWQRWMRGQDPAAIAAASVCRVEKLELNGEIRTYEEANYCSVDDEVLFGLEWVPVPQANNGQEAMRLALAGKVADAPEDGRPDRTYKDRESGMFKVRFKYRYPDYIALARMVADTRAARRAGKRAFPMVAAKVELAQKQIQAIIDQQQQIEEYRQARGTAKREKLAEDPYATEEEVKEHVEQVAPDHVTHPVNVEDQPIDEPTVRCLYSLAEERVGGDAHQTLKRFLADARGLAADDPKVLEDMNPHRMNVREWKAVIAMIDRLPKREDKEPVEELEPLALFVCPNCGNRDESESGSAPLCSAGCGVVMCEVVSGDQGELPLD